MAIFETQSDPVRIQNQNADFEAVNNSATFMCMVAFVAIVVAVPLALFF